MTLDRGNTHIPNPTIHTAMIAGLEAAINKALTLDPSTQNKLVSLQHHCFHLRCTSPEIDIYLIPDEKKIRLCGVYEGNADTQLSGSATAFANLITSNDPASTLINSDLELHGDSNALMRLQEIAHDLDLDWEAPLVSVFGDVIGHQMGRGLRHGMAFGKQLFNGIKRQVEDYIVEESNTLPSRWEAEKFFNDIDQLAMRTERLSARFNKYNQRSTPK